MKMNTVSKYFGKYFFNKYGVPFKNNNSLMFYGKNNDSLRLKKINSDKSLKRYSSKVAARICLKNFFDNYFIAVRPHSDLDKGYQLASGQDTKTVNEQMINHDQLKREKVIVKRGKKIDTLELPPLPQNQRSQYEKKLRIAKKANLKKDDVISGKDNIIAQLKAKLQKKDKVQTNNSEPNDKDSVNSSNSDDISDNQSSKPNDDSQAPRSNGDNSQESQSDPKRREPWEDQ